MAHQNKIDWSDPSLANATVSFTMEPVKAGVLDYHVQIEGELDDLIDMLLRDPEAFKITGFARKVALVRALIGKTPDDEIWSIVDKLNEFRNKFAHGKPGPEVLQKYSEELLRQLQKLWPVFYPNPADIEQGKQLQILGQAMFAIRRFFREIKSALQTGT